MLSESNCALIDIFVNEFGEQKVYNGWRDPIGCIKVDKEKFLNRIYDVLNMMVFGNALVKPELECISQIESRRRFDNERAGQYSINVQCFIQNDRLMGMKIVPQSSRICIVLDEFDPPFMFVVNQLCHQMIHQYVFEVGQGMSSLFQAIVDEKQIDVHDEQFKQSMDALNKDTGLMIEEDYGQMIVSFIESTYKARTMNDEYAGKEELGLYDGFDEFNDYYIDVEKGSIPEGETDFIGDQTLANVVQDALFSSTPMSIVQKTHDTIQINIT